MGQALSISNDVSVAIDIAVHDIEALHAVMDSVDLTSNSERVSLHQRATIVFQQLRHIAADPEALPKEQAAARTLAGYFRNVCKGAGLEDAVPSANSLDSPSQMAAGWLFKSDEPAPEAAAA